MALPIAVLVSGSGSNLQALIDRVESGALEARIALVLSNKPDSYGLKRARSHGIPALCIPHTEYADRLEFDRAMIRAIREAGAETVVLAGFMRMLSAEFLKAFAGRVLNIHPALLPSFPGVRGQRDAADYGVTLAGCTVHFVDELMDHGEVVIQAAVPAYPDDDGDSLAERILALEHRILPQAVQWLAQGRIQVKGRKVHVTPTGIQRAVPPANALVNPPLEQGF
ncbi:phosphoribosylglycinamide formyltransferase [Fundidesulfovibrio putealis]|uniref:phosphoribosylglycinamide formyltransferase n=1 Tax=Fundidesulfovibrio putealis TaxID=270496 RepID=UPI00042791E5|nr:phosphoribosylglycinamide formyltransferase [Fundidesulfovibrio putealis]